MNKLVSILMPVFNAEKWLADSINSVINQSYSNWELILVDDGSIDRSVEIANLFAAEEKRIQVYQQLNGGACIARNKAFERSKGDYIQYLDSDDLLSENKIEKQLLALELLGDENAIANCSWSKFKSKKDPVVNEKKLINKSYEKPINWLIDSWLTREHGQTNCWLTPRHIIIKAGKWDESLKVNQDGEFFCRVLLNATQIKYTEEVMVFYRMENPNSVSQQGQSKARVESLLSSYMMYELHLGNYLENKNVKMAIIKNYIHYLSRFDRYYPELSEKVWLRIRNLGEENVKELIDSNGNRLSKLLGFKNYLRLAKLKVKIYK